MNRFELANQLLAGALSVVEHDIKIYKEVIKSTTDKTLKKQLMNYIEELDQTVDAISNGIVAFNDFKVKESKTSK